MSDIRVTYAGLISFLGGLIALVTGIIFTLIVTRTLSPEEYGSWGLIFSVVGYFVMIQPIITYWTTREIARNLDSGKTAVASTVGLSFGILPIFIIIAFFLADQTGINHDVFFLAIILIPTTFLNGVLMAINLGYKPHAIGFSTIFFGLSEIPLALIFVYYLEMGISGVILTVAIAHIVSIIILLVYARQKIRNKFKKEYLRKWLKFSWIPLYPSVYNILGESTIVIFTLISGSIIGIAYWAASLVLASIIAPAGLVSRAVYPKLLEDKGKTFFRDNITLLFYFGILFTSLVIIFARPGLFALNPFYEIAVPVVVIMAIEGFLVLLTSTFQTALIGIEKVDTFTGSTSKDYLKSNLFHVNTIRLIQTIGYVIILIVGLIILTQYTNSEIDLLVYWAIIALITQIPLVSYFAILIKRNFESPFDLKRILKFLIVCIAMSILTHFLLEQFITYTPDLYLFLPNVLLLIIFGVGIYLISTYIIDSKTRYLFSAIIGEIIKKK